MVIYVKCEYLDCYRTQLLCKSGKRLSSFIYLNEIVYIFDC